jgi:hypothetical protein
MASSLPVQRLTDDAARARVARPRAELAARLTEAIRLGFAGFGAMTKKAP